MSEPRGLMLNVACHPAEVTTSDYNTLLQLAAYQHSNHHWSTTTMRIGTLESAVTADTCVTINGKEETAKVCWTIEAEGKRFILLQVHEQRKDRELFILAEQSGHLERAKLRQQIVKIDPWVMVSREIRLHAVFMSFLANS